MIMNVSAELRRRRAEHGELHGLVPGTETRVKHDPGGEPTTTILATAPGGATVAYVLPRMEPDALT
jgi:hypothetical protein